MSLCDCPERPRCEFSHGACGAPADWSMREPPWKLLRPERFIFMCDWHKTAYVKVMTHGIRGMTRPEGADEDWRGSLVDVIRHAQIAEQFERRDEGGAPHQDGDSKRYTPAQLQQVYILRRYHRDNGGQPRI